MINNEMQVKNIKVVNRVVLQPMEGCDCISDGSSTDLTVVKYIRAARIGAVCVV